jgi:hypothetical protein
MRAGIFAGFSLVDGHTDSKVHAVGLRIGEVMKSKYDLPAKQDMFLCFPKGYEERTAAIIAIDEQEASTKCMVNKGLREAVELLGAELCVTNLSAIFEKQGYDIFIQRKGNYH